jgi:hypothetical protein
LIGIFPLGRLFNNQLAQAVLEDEDRKEANDHKKGKANGF